MGGIPGFNTSLATLGALAHRLQRLNACFIQNGRLGQTLYIGPSYQLSQNKFFDLIVPSMRTSKIQKGCQGAPKWPTGSGKVSTPRFLGVLSNFRKTSSFYPSTPSMRKGRDRENKTGKKP